VIAEEFVDLAAQCGCSAACAVEEAGPLSGWQFERFPKQLLCRLLAVVHQETLWIRLGGNGFGFGLGEKQLPRLRSGWQGSWNEHSAIPPLTQRRVKDGAPISGAGLEIPHLGSGMWGTPAELWAG
jgi:hypothetical protein